MRARLMAAFFLLSSVFFYRCSAPPTASNFPQFHEVVIAGPGRYDLPQWSPDGKYLAFIKDDDIVVYDTRSGKQWSVASHIQTTFFDWSPDGLITYLRRLPDETDSREPSRLESDLRSVDPDTKADSLIAGALPAVMDFAWFSDETRLLVLVEEPDTIEDYKFNDIVYLLDLEAGSKTALLSAGQLDLNILSMLDLSADERSLLLYGVRISDPSNEGLFFVYDMANQKIEKEMVDNDFLPGGTRDWPAAIGDYPNFGWVGGDRWVLALVNTLTGECSSYSLFFLDTTDPPNSFCIPSADQPVAAPVISPDLSRLAYISVGGVARYYVVISELTTETTSRLESK